jgi:hypothetical protein
MVKFFLLRDFTKKKIKWHFKKLLKDDAIRVGHGTYGRNGEKNPAEMSLNRNVLYKAKSFMRRNYKLFLNSRYSQPSRNFHLPPMLL